MLGPRRLPVNDAIVEPVAARTSRDTPMPSPARLLQQQVAMHYGEATAPDQPAIAPADALRIAALALLCWVPVIVGTAIALHLRG